MKIMTASAIGTVLEYYDFVIFIILTPLIAPLFFPAQDPLCSLISGYAAFAMSFLMRPLGGYMLGAIGDRYGRDKALSLSIVLMGGATLVMACLPTYQSIGVLAPVLLIACRLLQGFSVGGEYSGAALMIIETAPKESLFRNAAVIPMAAVLSVILASKVTKIWALDQNGWSWRIPLFFGASIAFVGFYLRRFVGQSLSNDRPRKNQNFNEEKLFSRENLYPLALMTFLSGLGVMVYYVFTAYIIAFLTNEAGWEKGQAYSYSFYVSVGAFALMYPISKLADQYLNPWRIIRWACIGLVILPLPFFYIIGGGNAFAAYIFLPVIITLFAALVLINPLAAQLFKPSIRYQAMAVSYTVGASVFGGTSPLVNTFLSHHTGLPFMAGFYLVLVAGVCTVLLRLKDNFQT